MWNICKHWFLRLVDVSMHLVTFLLTLSLACTASICNSCSFLGFSPSVCTSAKMVYWGYKILYQCYEMVNTDSLFSGRGHLSHQLPLGIFNSNTLLWTVVCWSWSNTTLNTHTFNVCALFCNSVLSVSLICLVQISISLKSPLLSLRRISRSLRSHLLSMRQVSRSPDSVLLRQGQASNKQIFSRFFCLKMAF